MDPTPTSRRADRIAFRLVATLTVLIVLTVAGLRFIHRPEVIPTWATLLPALNATLNSATALALVLAYVGIRRGKVGLHMASNVTAFVLSSFFLISYVVYHALAPSTAYPENVWRPVYLAILLSHIFLAALVLPMVLTTFWLALTHRNSTHRALARWTFPIWLYVTVTGVVVYLMISPYYPF